ncbi:guanine-specific ribonuclease N1 and T1 [Streptomyces bambusae]|uniref:ribonuclease domain-containing protein n=1 Tax=Streptomyces bambusae TaxID=1550616 RepID=UPI001CFDDAD2|nr:ribonuclease domain-containing protein [Streptomyces bambusae]MCB5165287.1 guanine-specific ribonuclease N1 and T1 [Streptomyces bambusae]
MIFRNVLPPVLRALGAVFLCAALVAAAAGCTAGKPASPGAKATPGRSGTATAVPGWARGMKTVREADLPSQARDTLRLIDRGGPYPYRQDGTVFGNFERVLPRQKRGYYHEYTVKTPGSPTRGARRIVTGGQVEFYYTDDHYKTFKAVLR